MDIQSLLEANNTKLINQYKEHLDLTLSLQKTLIEEVLPQLQDELQWNADTVDWARDWFEDTSSIFQFLRRHKFTKSFALESIRQNLIWRIETIYPNLKEPPLPLLRCLPLSVSDPFGRPIIILKISALAGEHGSEDLKRLLMPTIDRLQAHLQYLNRTEERKQQPILQYIVLLDLANVSMQNVDINLITWSMRDVIPRFPGMIAAVFMLNYSWTHSGLWTIVKRVLPAAALSRIFFPSKKELEEFFTPSCLPKDYGGKLLRLSDLDDPLRPNEHTLLNETLESLPSPSPSPASVESRPTPQLPTWISPMSFQNPFFGYPTMSHSSQRNSFEAGPRRMRDLLRTLAKLWWERWKKHVSVVLWLVLALGGARIWVRRGGTYGMMGVGLKGLARWKDLWATGLA